MVFSWFFHPKIGSTSKWFQDKESDSEDEEDDTAREQQMQLGQIREDGERKMRILRFHSIFSGCLKNIRKNVVHIWIKLQPWCNKLDSLPTLNWASSLQRTRFVFHTILCQDNRNWLSILEETNPSKRMKFWSNSGTLQGTLGNSQFFEQNSIWIMLNMMDILWDSASSRCIWWDTFCATENTLEVVHFARISWDFHHWSGGTYVIVVLNGDVVRTVPRVWVSHQSRPNFLWNLVIETGKCQVGYFS